MAEMVKLNIDGIDVEIEKGRGTQFDAEILDAFIELRVSIKTFLGEECSDVIK